MYLLMVLLYAHTITSFMKTPIHQTGRIISPSSFCLSLLRCNNKSHQFFVMLAQGIHTLLFFFNIILKIFFVSTLHYLHSSLNENYKGQNTLES